MTTNNTSKVIEGFVECCKAVEASMGYNGGVALMENHFQPAPPRISGDGITIARAVNFKNKEKQMGCILAKQASAKTLVLSGDSTSSTLALSRALIEATYKDGVSNFNPKVKEGIEIATNEAVAKLIKLSKETDEKAVKAIATISADNNEKLGELLLEAYQATKESGTINVEKNEDNPVSFLKISNGFSFSKGWKSPFLITDPQRAVFDQKDVNVLLYEGYITPENAQQISNFIVEKASEPIVIVCERIVDETLARIIDNHQRGQLNICIVEAPEYDVKRTAYFSDIALYCNTEVFKQGISQELQFGKVDKVVIDQGSTTFIQNEVPEAAKEKLEALKGELVTTSEVDFIQKRISSLSGVSATIYIGHHMSEGADEQVDRAQDAVCAIKSSLAEGWVAGGGSAFAYISHRMNKKFKNEDIQFGYEALKKALLSIIKVICENSKVEAVPYISAAKKSYGQGFNAKKMKQSNLITDKVIDSTKSLRVALENAKSVVELLLNVRIVTTL